jgi:hypothetical protein
MMASLSNSQLHPMDQTSNLEHVGVTGGAAQLNYAHLKNKSLSPK